MVKRKTPEEFLQEIQAEEARKTSGRLKIFFGFAAGVGKTYAMLEAAHMAQKHRIDVVSGYIEPHARPETAALLEGLEALPVQEIQYNGIVLREFDVDAALARKPQLILVDELAHSNAPGCRHTKRYQDVQELLKNGIDVYTTVNVQHIESLNEQSGKVGLKGCRHTRAGAHDGGIGRRGGKAHKDMFSSAAAATPPDAVAFGQ